MLKNKKLFYTFLAATISMLAFIFIGFESFKVNKSEAEQALAYKNFYENNKETIKQAVKHLANDADVTALADRPHSLQKYLDIEMSNLGIKGFALYYSDCRPFVVHSSFAFSCLGIASGNQVSGMKFKDVSKTKETLALVGSQVLGSAALNSDMIGFAYLQKKIPQIIQFPKSQNLNKRLFLGMGTYGAVALMLIAFFAFLSLQVFYFLHLGRYKMTKVRVGAFLKTFCLDLLQLLSNIRESSIKENTQQVLKSPDLNSHLERIAELERKLQKSEEKKSLLALKVNLLEEALAVIGKETDGLGGVFMSHAAKETGKDLQLLTEIRGIIQLWESGLRDLGTIRYFKRLAETRSFSAAGSELDFHLQRLGKNVHALQTRWLENDARNTLIDEKMTISLEKIREKTILNTRKTDGILSDDKFDFEDEPLNLLGSLKIIQERCLKSTSKNVDFKNLGRGLETFMMEGRIFPAFEMGIVGIYASLIKSQLNSDALNFIETTFVRDRENKVALFISWNDQTVEYPHLLRELETSSIKKNLLEKKLFLETLNNPSTSGNKPMICLTGLIDIQTIVKDSHQANPFAGLDA